MAASPLLSRADSVLVVIDMQPKLVPHIIGHEQIISVQSKLIAVARELDVPVLLTEHYSKGLGATIPELVAALGGTGADSAYQPIEKITFSAFADEGFRSALEATGRRSPVLVGIESHICICQTALEAAAFGYDVHVVPDAISARNEDGRRWGIERMQGAGIAFDTFEMVVYQWLQKAGTPEFKTVLQHVK